MLALVLPMETHPKDAWREHTNGAIEAKYAGKKEESSVVDRIGILDEFKMAKSCKEYSKLITQLPEIFIGKSEHLKAIVRLMCDAAKRSTVQQRIHLAPWRKRNFMQMKWLAIRVEIMISY
ncbi:hypothetical protein HAX54_002230 [Datura stramonium]|uniref:Uncharacterized protein n=1 Tax=Datura stramonium TaxID=4076 RepID=A0ABS8T4D9_DATST|nr:hypothetical protein [Datura stramonium]